jgi:hypothetical protein
VLPPKVFAFRSHSKGIASTYVGEFERGGRTGVGVEIKLTEGKVQKVSGSWRNGSLLESRELDFLMGDIKAFIFSTTREVESELKGEGRRAKGEGRRALERAKAERLKENERINHVKGGPIPNLRIELPCSAKGEGESMPRILFKGLGNHLHGRSEV